MTESRINPESNNPTLIVGREAIYARLQQHVLDPPHRQAILFTGHDGIGKTALLQHFTRMFDNQILGVYFPLSEAPLHSTDAWIDNLIERTNEMLEAYNFTVERVTSLEEVDNETYDNWFRDIYLFEVMHLIRPHRRMVWLFDDIEYLLDALPEQVTYLHQLLQTHLQLTIICTLNTEYEDRIADLAPLVTTANSERLHRLSVDDSINLIRQYAPGSTDEMVSTIYNMTGGHPLLLSNIGTELNKAWASHSDNEALRIAQPAAYNLSQAHFRQLWQRLSQNERIVLTTIANLIYDDPLRNVGVDTIQSWLIETDYPLDTTTIHAALRGLDYLDIVNHQRNAGYKIVAGMMQTWLLEHARLSDIENGTASGIRMSISWRAVIGVVIIVILLTILLFSLPTPISSPTEILPTVTLAQ